MKKIINLSIVDIFKLYIFHEELFSDYNTIKET